MLQRLYAHNFRCLENFEFKPEQNSTLLVGKNGAGKSTVRDVLAIFQSIGRGETQIKELVKITDFTRGRTDVPMSFELEILLNGNHYRYEIAFELPQGFKAPRVLRESVVLNEQLLLQRQLTEIRVSRKDRNQEDAVYSMDWHILALPLVYTQNAAHPLETLRDWMAAMVLLSPFPSSMLGETSVNPKPLHLSGSNFVDWLSELLEAQPTASSSIMEHLKTVMPDVDKYRWEKLGRDSRALMVSFKSNQLKDERPFESLSDGEKIFFLWAVLLAALEHQFGSFFFWDEPENFLAIQEVSEVIIAFKRSIKIHNGQLIMSSHSLEAINTFSTESSWVIGRRGHLDPSQIRCLDLILSSDKTLTQVFLEEGIDSWL